MTIEEALIKIKKDLSNYVIELGVISGESEEREEVVYIGVTNADLMFIHENGSPVNNIPKRPVLQMAIDYAKEELLDKYLDRAIDKYLETFNIKDFEIVMNRLCVKIESYARDIIYLNDGRLEKNAPDTAYRKGKKALKNYSDLRKEYNKIETKSGKRKYVESLGNHPLFDTGQLARSIVCRLRKIN